MNGFAIEPLIMEMIRLVAGQLHGRGFDVEFARDPTPGEWGSWVQVGLPIEYKSLDILRVSELLLADIAKELVEKVVAGVRDGATIKTAAWLPRGAVVLSIQTGEGIGMGLGSAPMTGVTGETVIIFGMRHWV